MSAITKNRPRRPATPPPPQPKKLPILWIMGGLVGLVLVAAIAIGLSGETSTTEATVTIGSPTVSGDALPAFTPGSADAAVGMQIPSAAGTDFDGEKVVIGPGIGPAGILFVAHWCSHCQTEVPAVQSWLDGGATPSAPIYSVATGIDEGRVNYPPWSWLDREGWSSPVLVDDAAQSTMRAFGGTGFPYWVFIDDSGAVVARASGAIGIDALDQILAFAAGS